MAIQARIDAPGIQFEDAVFIGMRNIERVDIALGVIEVMARFRIDPAHGTDHLRAEQDVSDVDHLGEQVDARLVIDAGVEEHVAHHMLCQRRTLQHVRQAAIAAPMIRNGSAAMGDYETQRRKVAEQIAFDELHEGRGIRVDVMSAGRVEVRIARCRDVHHRRDVELHHLLVERIPVAIGEWRRAPMSA